MLQKTNANDLLKAGTCQLLGRHVSANRSIRVSTSVCTWRRSKLNRSTFDSQPADVRQQIVRRTAVDWLTFDRRSSIGVITRAMFLPHLPGRGERPRQTDYPIHCPQNRRGNLVSSSSSGDPHIGPKWSDANRGAQSISRNLIFRLKALPSR